MRQPTFIFLLNLTLSAAIELEAAPTDSSSNRSDDSRISLTPLSQQNYPKHSAIDREIINADLKNQVLQEVQNPAPGSNKPAERHIQIMTYSSRGLVGESQFKLAHNWVYSNNPIATSGFKIPESPSTPQTFPASYPNGYGVEWRLDPAFFKSSILTDFKLAQAALISVFRRQHPNWNWFDVKAALRQTGSNWENGYDKNHDGFGLVNHVSANALADQQIQLQPPQVLTEQNNSAQPVQFKVLPFKQSRRVKDSLFQFSERPSFKGNELNLCEIYRLGGKKVNENRTQSAITQTVPTAFSKAYFIWFTADNLNDRAAHYSRIDTYSPLGPLSQLGIADRNISTSCVNGDIDNDGDVDQSDVNLILQSRNTPISNLNDPRDLDSNGSINISDARNAIRLCSRPHCA